VARALPALGLGLACGLLPVPPVVTTVVGLAVYGLGLLLFGALPNEIREHLPGPLRRLGPAGPGD
jgi:hypothetical protein